ncbi:MAG: ROK family protein [Ktedonobacterales bacterium]|nr:ROK family protein [Ktedonobacterales bacterium]
MSTTEVVLGATLTRHTTLMQVALATTAGDVLARRQRVSAVPLTPATAITVLGELARDLQHASRREGIRLVALTFALEATLDVERGTVVTLPPSGDWNHDAFTARLTTASEALLVSMSGEGALPPPLVRLVTVTDAATSGEALAGAGRGAAASLFLDLSRTVACGVWWGGHLLQRPHLGALGHLPIPGATERCACGGIGHLETRVSAQALVRRMIGLLVEAPATEAAVMRLTGGRAEALTVTEIWQLACEGDPIAEALMAGANAPLAQAILASLLLLDVERVILGGSLAYCGVSWRDDVRARLASLAPPARAHEMAERIVLAELGPDVALRGTLALANAAARGIY